MTKIFDATSTTEDVLEGIDLKGKRVLVTGVSSGIGVETARSLSAHGAEVVGAARDLVKSRAAADQVGSKLELISLDLSSLTSVRACAETLLADGRPFDIVIANAGIMACPKSFTADGFEMQFGTNHLGHFVLVNRILPLLREGARVVNLSSGGHRFSDVDLDDPNFERTLYTEFVGYGRSKTANILFSVEFDRRHKPQGIRATAVHPGVIQTELMRYRPPSAGMTSSGYTLKSLAQGAATTVWAGVVAEPEAVGGRYCENCHVAGLETNPDARSGVRPYAIDPEHAKALWAKSEEMTGEKF